ncbi:MAG: isoleucine--tRNA ligase [Oscillospiraceae bacterium]|jgi:isoleucyl-tRNA synthetase|nr:isoleucine--tRNA ligase [Oscillospiraceae bacterium]
MESDKYSKTLNLPKTTFPMKAELSKMEPLRLENWEKHKIYEKLMEKNKGKPLFILHDGPPYANGKIHLGTALNKIIKDFIIKYKNMSGFCAPYIPGWDTHGLPTELKARKKAGISNSGEISNKKLREICRDFVLEYLNDQRRQFKRLGITADWENPYVTLQKQYESVQINIFSKMALNGYIYRGLRPVHWCTNCKTALAEAEIEHQEDPCYSIFVKFPVKNDFSKLKNLGAKPSKTYFVIWTTTAWTLPGNVAISVSPNSNYALVKYQNEYYVVAEKLCESCFKTANIEDYSLIGIIKGEELEHMTAYHPFLNRESLVILSNHVTLDSGTGCVHTAPGHGLEDFQACKKYKKLEVIVPVDSDGKLTEDAGEFKGLFVKGFENTDKDAGRAIAAHLNKNGLLLATKKIRHKYPHCWRCKDQVIFRATNQWFCSIDDFKNTALNEIENVKFIPFWGKNRISTMIKDRKDWCISRQRKWGVPIPIFFCKNCSEPLIEKNAMDSVEKTFKKYGSDSWFERDIDEFLDREFKCKKCGCNEFEKEEDIMDVWFDSGVSHVAVCKNRENFNWPYDLCLEGADQYRGWFQSSILTSVAVYKKAPYKTVLTHGWVVDGNGRKMSKSLGNGIDPDEVVNRYGADILRLWVASSDYRADIKISEEILKQLSESYRKIRNTARFILGNLYDFKLDIDSISIENLESIDCFMLAKLDVLLKDAHSAYEDYEFHKIYHSVYNFCTVDLSNFYLDVIKDRLYVERENSKTRRAAQTTIYTILDIIIHIIFPILPYTSDEIFKQMPNKKNKDCPCILLSKIPRSVGISINPDIFSYWKNIQSIQNEIKKILEQKRKEKEIGSSLEAKITLYFNDKDYNFIKPAQKDLKSVLIVSDIEILKKLNVDGDRFDIKISRAKGEKCSRCWVYSETVGSLDDKHLCQRCFDTLFFDHSKL